MKTNNQKEIDKFNKFLIELSPKIIRKIRKATKRKIRKIEKKYYGDNKCI